MTPEWFKPTHQPDPDKPVEFQLRPLAVPELYEVQVSMDPRGIPGFDAMAATFTRNVVGWRGIEADCTPQARAAAMAATESVHGVTRREWMVWGGQVTGHLYRQAMLEEPERKNS